MRTTKVAVVELLQDPANVRQHSAKNIETIKASLARFGQQKPIVVDGDGVVVAGNGTLAAARELGWQEVAIVKTKLTGSDRTAYAIADNRTAELAEWDDAALAEQLSALAIDDDELLAAAGFDEAELEKLVNETTGLGADDVVEDEAPKPPAAMWDRAWRNWCGEVVEQIEALRAIGTTFLGVTPSYAAIQFLRAKFSGGRYPKVCSYAFHPQQIDTPGDSRSPLEAMRLVCSGEIRAERARFALDKSGPGHPKASLLSDCAPFSGAKPAPDFPAHLARDLISEYAKGGAVLDPCHGWGGRLVGFLLSSAASYVGVDVSPLQSEGCKRLWSELAPYCDSKSVELICGDFANAEVSGAFDFALTSPPYFDVEKYLGGKQAHQHGSYGSWVAAFYRPLLTRTFDLLRDGGVFALQVGSQKYPLLADGEAIAQEVGFLVDKRVVGFLSENQHRSSGTDSGECLLLLRKPGV